jgi:predicted small metal-binding protein
MKMLSLSCKDMGVEKCDYVAMGETKEDVIKMTTDHMMKSHPKEAKEAMEKMSKEELEQKMTDNMTETEDDM